MLCPKCGGQTKVRDTYMSPDGKSWHRRRICLNCGERFTTNERIAGSDSGEIDTFESYQHAAARTQNAGLRTQIKRLHALFGLASEVGEVHSMYQHRLQDGQEIPNDEVVKECGDILWFLSEFLDTYGISLWEVAQKNIEKLRKRYPQGFDRQRSKDRHTVDNE